MTEKKNKPMIIGAESEIEVVLPPVNEDEEIFVGLTHVFRQLTAEDNLTYHRKMTQTETLEGPKGESRKRMSGDYWAAVAELYDRCIIRTEGYQFPEGAENWKELMYLQHKQWAIELLFEKAGGYLSPLAVKNSPGTSEKP